MLERARPMPADDGVDDIDFTNHGGIAIVAPNTVQLTQLNTGFDPYTFEHLCARNNSCGASCIVLVIYQSGSEHVTQQFSMSFLKC